MGLRDRYIRHVEKQWAKKSPEEQAAILTEQEERVAQNDAYHASVEGQADAAWEASRTEQQERLDAQVLGGPAGAAVWGTLPDAVKPSDAASGGAAADVRASLKGLKDTVRDLTSSPKDLLGVGSEFKETASDPAERERIASGERGARDAARLLYRAPDAAPVIITRIATRGATQHDEVCAHLTASGLSARPDLVYGAYRVPDRLSPKLPGTEAGRAVEWDVVHAATAPLPPGPPVQQVHFDADRKWVRRRSGDPSVLDEDLALTWLAGTGLGPEACLGIARDVVMQRADSTLGQDETGDAASDVYVRVRGVAILHTGAATAEPDGELPVPADGVPGTFVAVLNWAAVRAVVHPRPQRGPEVPSPFPYLPSTPQELLVAYLEIVGVRPRDCFGAAVTTDRYTEAGEVTHLRDGQVSLDDLKLTDAPKQPSADGKDRRRLQVGSRVVITYRDLPEYAGGRERWEAYQRDVLFARLQLQTGVRAPISDGLDGVPFGGALRKLGRLDDKLDALGSLRRTPFAHDLYRTQARYCEPLDR